MKTIKWLSIPAVLMLLALSIPSFAANFGYSNNSGTVERLYPTTDRVYFRINGINAMSPAHGYYYVPTSHSNYQALVDLLYKAAEDDWVISARTKEQLDHNGYAEVIYFVVDF